MPTFTSSRTEAGIVKNRQGRTVSRQRRYQAAHQQAGLCPRCPQPLAPGYRSGCWDHLRGKLRRPRWSQEKLAEFIRAVNSGVDLRHIATVMGITINAVRANVKRLRAKGYNV